MSPEVLDRFFESRRATSLPFADWLTGERLLLVQGRDFTEDSEKVRIKLTAYAKRRNWAVLAVLARRPTDPPRGPAPCIQVWGDPSRTYDQGAPDELYRELGVTRRRKSRVSS